MLNVAIYSLASMFWPDDVELALSLLEAFSGIGMILGPIVGSAVYTWFGFKLTFFVFGSTLVPIAILSACFFARRLSREIDIDDSYKQLEEVVSTHESQ